MTQYVPDPEGGWTTEQVKEEVREQAQAAQERARGGAGQTRSRLRDQVDQRSTRAGERLAGTAADVRSVAEELRRQDKDTPARLAEQAAGQTDRVADYLKGASGERLLRDIEDFARGKPWAVAAGGLVLGFTASRFLKASSSRRYQAAHSRMRSRDGNPPRPTRAGPGGAAGAAAGRAAQAAVGADHPAGPPGARAGQGRTHPKGQASRRRRRAVRRRRGDRVPGPGRPHDLFHPRSERGHAGLAGRAAGGRGLRRGRGRAGHAGPG